MFLESIEKSFRDDVFNYVDSFIKTLSKINLDRISVSFFDGMRIDYYGVESKLNQVCSMFFESNDVLIIKPFEKKFLPFVYKNVVDLNLNIGVCLLNDSIKIVLLKLTEEKRISLRRKVSEMGENAKIVVRGFRKKVDKKVREIFKNGAFSKDDEKNFLSKVDDITFECVSKIERAVKFKNGSLMNIG